MMPIRGDVHVAIEYDGEPGEMTLRQCAEWYKRNVRVFDKLGTATKMETTHITQAWTHLMEQVAKREEVPSGFLAYLVQELARSEMRALEEAEAANAEEV